MGCELLRDDEQDLLEQMLDNSKLPLPAEAKRLRYLLAAPFRYRPQTGSRFRNVNMSGMRYGAGDPYSACAEIACWRQHFLLDSVGLIKQQLSTEHSMYEAVVAGCAIDLLSPPWNKAQAHWMHHSDYTDSQKLGELVRKNANAAWIRYASVRAPEHTCAAIFDPRSLTMVTEKERYEQWHCHTTHDRVTLSNSSVRFDF